MREQLEVLRRAVAAGEVDAVIVSSASSLSRDRSELLVLLEEFDAHDVAVHFVQDAPASEDER